MAGWLDGLWDGFLAVFFPSGGGCPVCGKGTRRAVCPVCAAHFRSFTRLPVCPRCGRFVPVAGKRPCAQCRGDWPLALARACAPYEGPARTAVLRLKYGRRQSLATALGAAMAEAACLEPAFSEAVAVVPVPLSPSRRHERGFNQAELLAREVGTRLGLPLADILRKDRDTPPQASLPRAARKNNLEHAFRAAERTTLHGRAVILVDDVLTTGSTMTAAAKVLRQAGVARVYGLSFATGRANFDKTQPKP